MANPVITWVGGTRTRYHQDGDLGRNMDLLRRHVHPVTGLGSMPMAMAYWEKRGLKYNRNLSSLNEADETMK